MRYRLLVVACGLILSTPAVAQKVDLVCDGKYSDYSASTAPRDVPVTGAVLRVDLTANVVEAWSGIGGVTGRHRITERGDFSIRFVTSQGFNGFVNRWSGEFSVVSGDEKKFIWVLSGVCRTAKQIF